MKHRFMEDIAKFAEYNSNIPYRMEYVKGLLFVVYILLFILIFQRSLIGIFSF